MLAILINEMKKIKINNIIFSHINFAILKLFYYSSKYFMKSIKKNKFYFNWILKKKIKILYNDFKKDS